MSINWLIISYLTFFVRICMFLEDLWSFWESEE